MARTQKMRPLNDAKSAVIAENILKQNPAFLPSTDDAFEQKVIVTNHIPEYRRVVFLNGRDNGFPLDFHYSSKTHPIKIYKLLHGQEYDLSVEVIEHLEACREPIYSYRKNMAGHQEHYISSWKYLYQLRNVSNRVA